MVLVRSQSKAFASFGTQILKGVIAFILSVAVVLVVVSCSPSAHPNELAFLSSEITEGAPHLLRDITTKPTRRSKDQFVITFVGDTMFQNTGFNWEYVDYGEAWNPIDGFASVRPLFNKTDFLVMNLEGPITDLPISVDPKKRSSFNYSFSMHPRVADVIKELGVDAVNLANNHQSDRNMQGYLDTKKHLDRAGIRYFGSGLTAEEQAEPLMVEAGHAKVGITGFMDEGYCCDKVPIMNETTVDMVHITLRATTKMTKMAVSLLEERGADIKIAFPHWLGNYVSTIKPKRVRNVAEVIAKAGYDLIIGSDGSHTVKEFDFITSKKTPCFYDIGNFVFQKWGKFRRMLNGKEVLPYGTVTHVILEHGKLDRLEIYCTLIDNRIVMYRPRPCTISESSELFSNLGPHINHRYGDLYATVDLRKNLVAEQT
jgi:poly-gamma-glutamate capsule biosynthesis protein CapA/YwtB (metallophosphatase superfamily)